MCFTAYLRPAHLVHCYMCSWHLPLVWPSTFTSSANFPAAMPATCVPRSCSSFGRPSEVSFCIPSLCSGWHPSVFERSMLQVNPRIQHTNYNSFPLKGIACEPDSIYCVQV